MSTILLTGASRGLGHAFNLGLPEPGDSLWLVSRSEPKMDASNGVTRHWIQADLSEPKAATTIAEALGNKPLDTLIYNAGIWENTAFSSHYNFEAIPEVETLNILNINLTVALLCVQKLLPNLYQSVQAKIILIGSTSGMDNPHVPEVAYNTSKMGLRGLAQALRENLRERLIPVTCINPGSIATVSATYEMGREATVAATHGKLIPMQDMVTLVRCVLSLSNATCVKEIDLPATADTNA
jgi:short-subunit dehydrogenase